MAGRTAGCHVGHPSYFKCRIVWRCAGLEQYTEQHWSVISPQRLGFKGSNSKSQDAESAAAEAEMAAFFAPLNARLDALMAQHGYQWQPFAAANITT